MASNEQSAAPITNTLFPPPPEYFKQFTDENLARFEHLSSSEAGPSRSTTSDNGGNVARAELSDAEKEELERLKSTLGPPRADWIKEEGRWVTFGEMYTTSPHIPSAEDIGLERYVDPAEPPQTALTPLLHSFLHTLLLLIDTLTGSARPPDEQREHGWGHEGDQYIQHLSRLSANMMVSANSLRGVQAEATLVLLMEKQLETRRAQTEALRIKCRNIASQIKALKTTSEDVLNDRPVLPSVPLETGI